MAMLNHIVIVNWRNGAQSSMAFESKQLALEFAAKMTAKGNVADALVTDLNGQIEMKMKSEGFGGLRA